MAKRNKKTDASYLDKLGRETARAYAFVVRVQAARDDNFHSLSEKEVGQLLDGAIEGLHKQGKIDWTRTNTERKQVFIMSWYNEMQKLGIA
jgi:hypothetical protein